MKREEEEDPHVACTDHQMPATDQHFGAKILFFAKNDEWRKKCVAVDLSPDQKFVVATFVLIGRTATSLQHLTNGDLASSSPFVSER